MIAPIRLRDVIRSGLPSFPVAPFDALDRFNPVAFAAQLECLAPNAIVGLIDAGRIHRRAGKDKTR